MEGTGGILICLQCGHPDHEGGCWEHCPECQREHAIAAAAALQRDAETAVASVTAANEAFAALASYLAKYPHTKVPGVAKRAREAMRNLDITKHRATGLESRIRSVMNG